MGGAFFFFLLLLPFAEAAAAAPPFRGGGCTDDLIWFSPCLPYVSSSPNNLTQNASTKCCDAFSSSFAPNSLCFCYLLRDPNILGFPLNTTRLLSLSSLCLSPPPTTSSSFDFLCAGMHPRSSSFFSFSYYYQRCITVFSCFFCSLTASPTLPPLTSAETLGIQSPPSTAAQTVGSASRSHGTGRERGNGRRGGGTTFYFPSFNGSTSTYTLLLSQLLLAIFFVMLANSPL